MVALITQLAAALIGALSAIVATIITLKRETKRANDIWIRNCRYDFCIELAGVLDSIYIPLVLQIGDDMESDTDDICAMVNIEEVKKHLEILQLFISENNGKIPLLLPADIRDKLVHLQSELYQLSEVADSFKVSDLKNSSIYNIAISAKAIVSLLRKELGIS